ncbi:hypothetical protein FAUST_8653 [Fusarium austroamericanum]|uniref:FAD-binding domain-containing protein n=1 Tax=Fusarium austroamericanum TaxID=282268 RepID=A0AAN6BXS2_FUSAU|nr:hypothetical protein FAUST_8653 [Fusarium austroamericanum]
MSSLASQAPIAIIGAGPGGLTLARLLQVHDINYIVYERDVDPKPRYINQGGTLDIHASSGQLALKEGKLFETFKIIARWEGSRVCMQNPYGTVKSVFGQDRDAPEIDRLQLRQMLLDSIPADKIKWRHGVKSVNKGATPSEHVIHFENGSFASGFRLIVGCDGAWSKVRPLVTSAKPEYSGKVFIEGSISRDNPSYEAAVGEAGPGVMLAMGQHKMLAVQQLADQSYRFYVGMDAPEDAYSKHLTAVDTDKTRREFLSSPDFFANWAPELKNYLADAEGPFHAWPLYRLPVSSLAWNRVPGMTLLGDAAHVSTPLVGEGVNMAMLDALTLSKAIVKCNERPQIGESEKITLENALEEYEKEMLERGRDHISRCVAREKEFFSENAVDDFINMINGTMGNGKE